MKASICLLLGVAAFSTLFLECSTASTGGDGLLGGVVGGVVGGVGDILKKLLSTATTTVNTLTGTVTSLWNEAGAALANTTGATNAVLTKVTTTAGNLLETAAKIQAAIGSGTTESLNQALQFIANADGLVKEIADISTANPDVAGLLTNVNDVVNTVPEILESLKKNIQQVIQVQVSV